MPAHEHINGVQFQYDTPDWGESHPVHRITATGGEGTWAGSLVWSGKGIREVDVHPNFRRQGVATSLWNEGHRLASENAMIPAPKHSSDRTTAGDAWARSVGGRLPRRKK